MRSIINVLQESTTKSSIPKSILNPTEPKGLLRQVVIIIIKTQLMMMVSSSNRHHISDTKMLLWMRTLNACSTNLPGKFPNVQR